VAASAVRDPPVSVNEAGGSASGVGMECGGLMTTAFSRLQTLSAHLSSFLTVLGYRQSARAQTLLEKWMSWAMRSRLWPLASLEGGTASDATRWCTGMACPMRNS